MASFGVGCWGCRMCRVRTDDLPAGAGPSSSGIASVGGLWSGHCLCWGCRWPSVDSVRRRYVWYDRERRGSKESAQSSGRRGLAAEVH
eukprot:4499490-Amphidinium_carterae.1